MRRLVVCCDGTWSTRTDDTNVRRLYELLVTTDTQVPRYFAGVGTEGNPVRRGLEGAFGLGLAEHIQEAYRWLSESFEPGDQVVLFGFSRGAFTVRSLVGMLAQCGLVRFSPEATARDRERLVDRVYREGYRGGDDLSDGFPRGDAALAFHPGFGPRDTAPVAFLGVWETIGALGVPTTFGLLSGLVGRADVAFHDLALSPDVRHARQALALDERRGPYVPSVWRTPAPGTHASFAQLWFPGAHGDVGGGQPSVGLSHGALRWMIDEATAAVGLQWTGDADGPAEPGTSPAGRSVVGDPCAEADDSADGLWRYLGPRPRSAPRVVAGAPDVHPSAVARQGCGLVPPYRPGVVPEVGESRAVTVPASEPWHETGLFLPAGRYRLAVEGRWTDHGAATPATGTRRWPLVSWPSYAVGTALGGLRSAIRAITGNPRADVIGSRRVPEGRWMELVAAVANDALDLDGTVHEGTTVPIGPDGARELEVPRPGYLYAFADDAWTGYGSNGGAVTLTVTRRAAGPRGR